MMISSDGIGKVEVESTDAREKRGKLKDVEKRKNLCTVCVYKKLT